VSKDDYFFKDLPVLGKYNVTLLLLFC
jgi:hypothetical protein